MANILTGLDETSLTNASIYDFKKRPNCCTGELTKRNNINLINIPKTVVE